MNKLACRLAGPADVETLRTVLQAAFAPLLAVVSSRPTALDEDAVSLGRRLDEGQLFAIGEQAGRAVRHGATPDEAAAIIPDLSGAAS